MDVDSHEARELPALGEPLSSFATRRIGRPLSPPESAAVRVLETYFCRQEEPSLRRALAAPSGWLPLSAIVAFRTVRAAGVDSNSLLAAVTLLPDAFEVRQNPIDGGPLVRRTVSFDAPSAAETARASVAPNASCVVLRVPTDDIVEMDFIAFVQSAVGRVARYKFAATSDEALCHLQFEDPQQMVKLLASSTPLVYEDNQIYVEAGVFPSLAAAPTPAVTVAPKSRTATALGYPLNRIVKFGPIVCDAVSGCTASSVQAAARAAFEKLAPIVFCVFKQNELYGHVRFKKSVAREIADILTRQGGGIDFGLGNICAGGTSSIVPVFALAGESERLLYDVLAEKAKANPFGELISLSTISMPSKSAVISRKKRSKAKTLRSKVQTSKAPLATVEGTLTSKSRKRQFGSTEMSTDFEKVDRRIAAIPVKSKKLKASAVDSLVENLVSGLESFS
ncbi:hypothetical protein HDU82_003094 [Entophlyctis luteolus]|nr:hypothetical protein HDU82_003094 [Entophlyctis luteolus]